MSYTYYTIARYPVPHSPGKKECFRKSLELFVKASRYFDPPMEELRIPHGEKVIPAYLRLPRGEGKRSVVINFGGIDSYKAECLPYDESLLEAGLGTCAVDMPGVGESPIKGSTTAESLFTSVVDYLEDRRLIVSASASSVEVLVATGQPRWLSSSLSACGLRWFGAEGFTISSKRNGSGSRPTRIVI